MPHDHVQIDQIRQRLEAAENECDAHTIVDLFADDVVLMVPNYPVQEGKHAAAHFSRDILEYFRAELDRHITYVSAEISVVGDIAFDRGTFSFDVRLRGKDGPFEHVTGKYLWLLGRRDDAWKLTRVIVGVDEVSIS